MAKRVLSALLVCCLSLPAGAGWYDDFESYEWAGWVNLQAPWVNAAHMGAYPEKGYLGSMGAQGPGNSWTWGQAFRPMDDGDDAFRARLFLSSAETHPGIKTGLFAGTNEAVDNVGFFFSADAAANATLIFWTENYAGGSYVSDVRMSAGYWPEDFESYNHSTLTAPWESIASQGSYEGIGHEGSKGCQGPGYNWEWGRAFRALDGATVVKGKLSLDPSNTHQGVIMALTVGTMSVSGGYPSGDDMVKFQLAGDETGSAATLVFMSEDYEGGAWVRDDRVYAVPFPDDFESYTGLGWDPLPAPWEDAASQGAYEGYGYGESMGCYGPGNNWEFGRAYRRISANDTVIAGKLYLDPSNTHQTAKFGLIGTKSVAGNGSYGNDDNVSAYLAGDDAGNATLTFWSEDYEGGSYVGDVRSTVSGLSAGTWYDVRITLNNGAQQATAEYKEVSAGTWTNVGTVPYADDFASTYLAVSCLRGGFIDDLGPDHGGALQAGVWYETRITVDTGAGEATGEYRVAGDPTWLTVATLPLQDDFAANYLAVSGLRSGYCDDVGPDGPGRYAVDTWYDVKMEVDTDADEATGWYRASDADMWYEIGTLPLEAGFDPNHVGIRANRNGYLDDVSSHVAGSYCAPPYLDGDLVQDCEVNELDLSRFVEDWLGMALDYVGGGWPEANPICFAPEIAAITVDGDLSDWVEASDWLTFGAWHEGGLSSTTRAQYAWNDTLNLLYIGIESTEGTALILEVGGLAADPNRLIYPNADPEATQLQFDQWSTGPVIVNQLSGITTGVVAASNEAGGTITIEIATPIYSDWANAGTAMDLTTLMDVYEYANVAAGDWSAADSQVTDGTYQSLYNTPVNYEATLIRLLAGPQPQSAADLPAARVEVRDPDYDGNLIVDLADFVVLTVDWMKQSFE